MSRHLVVPSCVTAMLCLCFLQVVVRKFAVLEDAGNGVCTTECDCLDVCDGNGEDWVTEGVGLQKGQAGQKICREELR